MDIQEILRNIENEKFDNIENTQDFYNSTNKISE
jgi:hypothetical protein